MNRIAIIIFLISTLGCNSHNADQSQTKVVSKLYKKGALSPVDTFLKYETRDSFRMDIDTPASVLYIGKVNSVLCAFWCLNDSMVIQFRKSGKVWKATDTAEWKLYASLFQKMDLNGDEYKDIRIGCPEGSAGNIVPCVFLFDPKSNSFRHNKYYDLITNAEYDQQKKFIRSWYYAGYVHPQNKMIYDITCDSLTFRIGATFNPDEDSKFNRASVEFYIRKGDKDIPIKTYIGKTERMSNIFDTAFWKD